MSLFCTIYWLEIADFNLHHLYLVPHALLEFRQELWHQKTRISGSFVVCIVSVILLYLVIFSKRQRITLRLLYAIGRPSVVCLSVVCCL